MRLHLLIDMEVQAERPEVPLAARGVLHNAVEALTDAFGLVGVQDAVLLRPTPHGASLRDIAGAVINSGDGTLEAGMQPERLTNDVVATRE